MPQTEFYSELRPFSDLTSDRDITAQSGYKLRCNRQSEACPAEFTLGIPYPSCLKGLKILSKCSAAIPCCRSPLRTKRRDLESSLTTQQSSRLKGQPAAILFPLGDGEDCQDGIRYLILFSRQRSLSTI
jgi:hypothetical protein